MSVYVHKLGSDERIFVAGLGRPGPPGSGGTVYEAGDGIVITTTPSGAKISVEVPVHPLTQAEYDALSDEDREKAVLYVITDGEESSGGSGGGGNEVPGVSSFNGRSGDVKPEEGDYTAEMVGAIPASTKIPVKTSDLANDSGFTTEANVAAAIQAAILDSWEASY